MAGEVLAMVLCGIVIWWIVSNMSTEDTDFGDMADTNIEELLGQEPDDRQQPGKRRQQRRRRRGREQRADGGEETSHTYTSSDSEHPQHPSQLDTDTNLDQFRK